MRGRQFLIPPASHDDDALLTACRAGDSDAARRLVGRRQRELTRLAYLLTGDAERATELAAAALLDLLRDPPEHLDQPGRELALELAKRYLRDPARSTWLDRSDSEHYSVDDERSRTKAALDRLSPDQRATLVLAQLAGIPERTTQRELGLESRRAETSTHAPARERVALAAGRSADAPVVDLFNVVLIEAPHADLWSELEAPLKRAWSARRRTERLLTAGALAAVLLVLGGVTVWLTGFRPGGGAEEPAVSAVSEEWPPIDEQIPTPTIARASFAAAPTIALPSSSDVIIEDLHLLRAFEQAGEGRSSLALYDPATNISTPLLNASGLPRISPDGRWIISATGLPDQPDMSLLAGGSLDGETTWEIEVATPRALALGTERIYAMVSQAEGAYAIQVLDLTSGGRVAEWPIEQPELQSSTLRAAMLVLAPGADRLTLLTIHRDSAQEAPTDRWLRELTVYRTDTGEVTEALEMTGAGPSESTGFDPREARLVPGENAVYRLAQDEATSQVHLEFVDLDTGAVSELVLPLQARSELVAARRGETELHLVPSNTGAVLYVIQSRQRQVAVVDMRSRSLIGAFPLTAGDSDRGLFASNLNHVAYAEALLAPDGARLYLVINRERNLALNSYPSQSPVWVLDTTTWEVTGRGMVDGMPRQMTMSGDGAHIYVRSISAGGSVLLTTLATATGESLNVRDDIAKPEWSDALRIDSVAQLYHEHYGIRPRTGPLAPADNPVLEVLPGVSVEAEGAIAGVEALVTTRIVHPVTGELATTDRTLRFDPNATLAIELSNGAERAIFVPASIEPGVYQGRVRMNASGNWSARVTVINRDGTTWTVEQPAAIEVAEGLVAADGGAYRFLVRPANPVNRRTITVRVWMVESQSGERLPEEIEFLDEITDDARIILTHPSGERIDEPLVRLDHASFLGWVRFGAAGEWSAEIVVQLGSTGNRVAISAGTLAINDLTEPYQRKAPTPAGGANPASD